MLQGVVGGERKIQREGAGKEVEGDGQEEERSVEEEESEGQEAGDEDRSSVQYGRVCLGGRVQARAPPGSLWSIRWKHIGQDLAATTAVFVHDRGMLSWWNTTQILLFSHFSCTTPHDTPYNPSTVMCCVSKVKLWKNYNCMSLLFSMLGLLAGCNATVEQSALQ